jgi:hypothetical protein
MHPESRKFDFFDVSRDLCRGFHELRVLVSHIGGVADEYDRNAGLEFLKSMKDIFPGISEIQELSTAESSQNESDTFGKANSTNDREDIEAVQAAVDERLAIPSVRNALLSAAKQLTKKRPIQGNLIRQGALTMLLSHFDSALASLLHVFYERYPEALSSDDRTFTLKDLKAIGSITDAEKWLVEKEIDSVLRESVETQLLYFRKRLKIDSALMNTLLPRLTEISQRRNIYVHNRGKVNRQYLNGVSQELTKEYGATDGEVLALSNEYLLAAIDTVELVSIMLTQVCWRKWEDAVGADRWMDQLTFEGLCDGRFGYVEKLGRFSEEVKIATEATRRIVVINHAIALRESGKADLGKALIEKFDWSAASHKFLLARAVLLEKRERFLELLPLTIASKELESENLEEWPLFRTWQNEQWFIDEVSKHRPADPGPQGDIDN